jgi:hypothetical protein
MSAHRPHSQHRIEAALRLAPMNRQQLAKCLSLHYRTVHESVGALETRRKVRARPSIARSSSSGPRPVVFELVEMAEVR